MGDLLDKVETFYARFAEGDLDAAGEILDPNVENVDPSGTLIGADAYKAYGAAFKRAFPDSRMTVLAAAESGDVVAVEGVYSGTHTGPLATPMGEIPATGRSLALPYADIFRFEDGSVVAHHVYYDQATFMQQLGLAPEPAAP